MLAAVLTVTLTGLFAGALLSVLSAVFEVSADEAMQQVREVLPGINCGICGYVGCDEYAKAVVLEGESIQLCKPGGGDTKHKLSDILDPS